MKFVLLLFLALPCFAQADLPDHGTLADIKGSKVYIVANTEHLKQMTKVLTKAFTIVGSTSGADFFLEYKATYIKEVSALKLPVETGQLDAYVYRDTQKVIVWTDSTSSGGSTAAKLSKRFITAWKKLN